LERRRPVRPVPVERQEEGRAAHEVRGDDLEQGTALLVRLTDAPDVAGPQAAETAVDQLRRRARRRDAEVATLAEHHREAGAGRCGDRSHPRTRSTNWARLA